MSPDAWRKARRLIFPLLEFAYHVTRNTCPDVIDKIASLVTQIRSADPQAGVIVADQPIYVPETLWLILGALQLSAVIVQFVASVSNPPLVRRFAVASDQVFT
jgi:hypothetical protein